MVFLLNICYSIAISKYFHTFDPAANLTSKLTQHFKFDAYKNWTERIQYTDGKGSYITERTIEYHKSN